MTEKVVSSFILRPDRLKKLPKSFLKEIDALDATQLAHLQAAFSKYVFQC
jgi:hypothetical protein